ncbi:MAG: hypothetical protein IRZ31_16145 [Thermogemmatispora sp.]|nr:hypothetical protein [Thermogemmatispora sp.]
MLQSRSKSVLARQIIRPRLFSVTPATSVTEAVRLVVVDEQGQPLGVVDCQQLLQTLIAWDRDTN